jgi:signal transduction histidine kinase
VLLVVSDVTQLVRAQQELYNLNQQLELRVQARTLELEQLNATLRAEMERREGAESELRDASVELSELSIQLMRAQELERQRIALELHDSVGQSLSAIKYTLEHAAQLTHPASISERDRRLSLAIGQVQRVIAEVRAISTNLRPTALDDLGVISALRALCREWAEVYQGIELTVNVGLEDRDVPDALRTSAFRTIQEALNNIARHSAATRAWVSIHRTPDGLMVEVADNGCGIGPDRKSAQSSQGMGLRGLRERAAHHGGKMEIVSTPGNGTLLRISWPSNEASQLPGKVA